MEFHQKKATAEPFDIKGEVLKVWTSSCYGKKEKMYETHVRVRIPLKERTYTAVFHENGNRPKAFRGTEARLKIREGYFGMYIIHSYYFQQNKGENQRNKIFKKNNYLE